MRKKWQTVYAEAREMADCPIAIVICVLCLEMLLQGPGCMGGVDCMGWGADCMGGADCLRGPNCMGRGL